MFVFICQGADIRQPDKTMASFLFERLPSYSEARSWPGYVRCLTRESCICPIRNSRYLRTVLACCRAWRISEHGAACGGWNRATPPGAEQQAAQPYQKHFRLYFAGEFDQGAPVIQPRLDPSSALFGSLREKRLELRHNLDAVAVRALNALLFVLTDRHRKGETLATLLAKIFVERHINPLLSIGLSLASSAKYYSASIAIFHLNAHSFGRRLSIPGRSIIKENTFFGVHV